MRPTKVAEILYKATVLALLIVGASLSAARELAGLLRPVISWGFQDGVPLWAWAVVTTLMDALLLGMVFQVAKLIAHRFNPQIIDVTHALKHVFRIDSSEVAESIPLDYRWR